MSVFFGVPNFREFSSRITIPKFNNRGEFYSGLSLVSIFSDGLNWQVDVLDEGEEDFISLKSSDYDMSRTFFCFTKKSDIPELCEKGLKSLKRFEFFTKTEPDFRANLAVQNTAGNVSSYQSEYPFEMLPLRGGIVSNINILSNAHDGARNYLIFVSIQDVPENKEIKLEIRNLSGEIFYETFSLANRVEVIELSHNWLRDECYLVSQGGVGIPIYMATINKKISLEHTHPPHEALFGLDAHKLVRQYKERFR